MADDLENASTETSDVDLLSEGADDETPPKDETPPEETTEKEETEEPTEEEEEKSTEEEEPEEEEEEITRPSWKDIKEHYPELAKNKDFREMFHREKAYSEVFPTVEDARDSAEKSNVFDFFDNSLSEGNPQVLLNALNPPTVAKFAENVLPALYQVHPELFARAVNPMIVEILNNISDRADQTGDKNLKTSILNVAKVIFGEFKIPARVKRTVDPELEREKRDLRSERERLIATQRNTFLESSDKSIKRQLSEAILDGIDPRNSLSEFTRNAILDKVLDETREELNNDKAFKSKMQHLFRLAERAGFPPDYKPRLISAYLGRAKAIALGLRAKHRAAAIGRRTAKSENKRIEGRPKNETTQNKNEKGNRSRKTDLDIILEGAD